MRTIKDRTKAAKNVEKQKEGVKRHKIQEQTLKSRQEMLLRTVQNTLLTMMNFSGNVTAVGVKSEEYGQKVRKKTLKNPSQEVIIRL